MTIQDFVKQGLLDIINKVEVGFYGQGNDLDMLALEEDLNEITEPVDDDEDD